MEYVPECDDAGLALYGGVFWGIEAQYAHLFRWATMPFGMISLADAVRTLGDGNR